LNSAYVFLFQVFAKAKSNAGVFFLKSSRPIGAPLWIQALIVGQENAAGDCEFGALVAAERATINIYVYACRFLAYTGVLLGSLRDKAADGLRVPFRFGSK
jgi:hypothetical protein